MPQGLSQRNALAGAGKRFLVNKYYLDDLYEKVIVSGIEGPEIARPLVVEDVVDDVLVEPVHARGDRTLDTGPR